MSKNSYALGQFLGKNWVVVLLFVLLVAVLAYWPSKSETKATMQQPVASASAPVQPVAPDPCLTGHDERFRKAGLLFSNKQFDEATDLLYECISTLTPAGKDLYVKALTQANAARAKIADAEAKALKREKKKAGVTLGMSQQDVLDSSWGRPSHINRTTNVRGVSEQWVYDGGYLYFDDGVLTSIQN